MNNVISPSLSLAALLSSSPDSSSPQTVSGPTVATATGTRGWRSVMERTLVIRPASHIFLGMSAKPLLYHTFKFAENAADLRHFSRILGGCENSDFVLRRWFYSACVVLFHVKLDDIYYYSIE